MDEAGINDDRDMLQEMRLALTLHRPAGHDAPAPTAAQILRMTTQHGAATTPFRDHIGGLAVGQAADIVVLDWDRVTYPWQDPRIGFTDVLLRRAKAQAVREVYVAGQLIYSGGRFMSADRKAELERLAQWLRSPQTEFEQDLSQLSEATAPIIQKFYKFYSSEHPIEER